MAIEYISRSVCRTILWMMSGLLIDFQFLEVAMFQLSSIPSLLIKIPAGPKSDVKVLRFLNVCIP